MLRSNWWQNYSSEMKKKSILSIVIHGNWIKCNHLTILFIQFCLILKMQQEWKKIIFISFHFDFDPDRISHDWLNLTICYNRFKKGWMKNAFAWQGFFSLLTLRFIAFYHEAKVLMPSLLRLYKSSMPDIESASNLRKKRHCWYRCHLCWVVLIIIEFRQPSTITLIGGLARMLRGCIRIHCINGQIELEFHRSQIYHAI